jgi:hypothetical protein
MNYKVIAFRDSSVDVSTRTPLRQTSDLLENPAMKYQRDFRSSFNSFSFGMRRLLSMPKIVRDNVAKEARDLIIEDYRKILIDKYLKNRHLVTPEQQKELDELIALFPTFKSEIGLQKVDNYDYIQANDSITREEANPVDFTSKLFRDLVKEILKHSFQKSKEEINEIMSDILNKYKLIQAKNKSIFAS